jgi:hypothetical protein
MGSIKNVVLLTLLALAAGAQGVMIANIARMMTERRGFPGSRRSTSS